MEHIDISTLDCSKLLNIGTVNTLLNNLRHIQDTLHDVLLDATLFYRGHADKTWNLCPGIYREKQFIKKEDYLVHSLIRHCPIDFQNCSSSFEDLVKMQHYELPTRLLDLSMSPLVGLYFAACSKFDKDGELIIFLIKNDDIYNYDDPWGNILSKLSFIPEDIVNVSNDSKKWRRLINYLSSLQEPLPYLENQSELDRVICILPKLDNPRVIRQQGAFFLFGIKNGAKNNMSNLDLSPIRCVVPASKKKKILEQLDQLGINEKFCFPEIDKVAHYFASSLQQLVVNFWT